MFKKVLIPFLLISISLFFALLSAEVFIRLTSNLELKYNFQNWCAPDDKPGPPGPYRVSSVYGVGYEIIPNAAPFVNRYGMLGKEHDLKKGGHCFRILVMGDSITERHWYVEKLEELLNADKKINYRFELWNAGVGGYSVVQYYYSLEGKLLKYQPEMVIIGLDLNDFDTRMVIGYKDAKNGVAKYYFPSNSRWDSIKPSPFLLRYSYFYRLLILNIDRWLNCGRKIDEKEDGFRYLAKIKDTCDKHRVTLVCFIFPYLKPYSEYSDNEKKTYKSIISALDGLKIKYHDLSPYFPESERYNLRRPEAKDDYVHPNREGHGIISEAMSVFLKENYFSHYKAQ